jgi:hypothetical protein
LFLETVSAQKITMPELISALDLSEDKMDTLMKHKSYKLLQKESDSGAIQVYYSNLERNPEGPDWVRSVTYTVIVVKNTKSKLIAYRTYRKKEYQEILEWLLNNNFKTIKKDNFGSAIHTVYDDGKQNILVKQVKQKLSNGVLVWSYEFEFGK